MIPLDQMDAKTGSKEFQEQQKNAAQTCHGFKPTQQALDELRNYFICLSLNIINKI